MNEAQKIFDYLPASYKNPTEKEYVDFLWDAFVTNYQAEKYPFAFLSYHMLFMCFVYFEIWQIKENRPEDFQKAMVGFNKDVEKDLVSATTPFSLWQINESSVFRFLKLIGMDNSDIGRFTKIVKERNEAAHSNGNIFYKNKESLDEKISEMLDCIDLIQRKSEPIIENAYKMFLEKSGDPENREFYEDENQIKEVFVHGNYLSMADIRIAMKYDISVLSAHPNYAGIQTLAQTLKDAYAENEG
jgi:hypothetical protein